MLVALKFQSKDQKANCIQKRIWRDTMSSSWYFPWIAQLLR